MGKNDVKAIQGFVSLIIAGLLLASGLAWTGWQLVSMLSVTALRVLVLTGAVVVPVTAFIGWRLGRYEAGAVLRGVDEVGNRVMGTAERVASLRVGVQRARKADANIVIAPLPLPPVVHRTAIDDDIVDL